jgi:hypothetical protein
VSGISDTDALIVDLRYNGGGRPETVAFILFYLLDGAPVRLNDFVDCNGSVKNSYSTMTKAELPEKAVRFGEAKPLFVLTSKETVLGGEKMVCDRRGREPRYRSKLPLQGGVWESLVGCRSSEPAAGE